MFSTDRSSTRQIFRKLASLVALAGVLLSSLGIVVFPTTKRNSPQAYPCQGGQCGCSSAAQCWQSCCCTSPAERMAWAVDNQVTPPLFLSELLAATESCESVNHAAVCCSQRAMQAGRDESPETTLEGEPLARVMLLSDLSRCRGLSRYLAIFGAAICEPLPDAWVLEFAPSLWLCTLDESFESPLPAPPTPPPRIVV